MKKILSLFLLLCLVAPSWAQPKADFPYQFTAVSDLPATSIKNQFRSGTCWSFSAASFLESELIRLKKGDYDLSEMFIVYQNYLGKANKYARLHGSCHFAGGGATSDIFWALDNYGLMPEEAYKGLEYGEDKHNHSELDRVLENFMKSVVNDNTKTLSTSWKKAFVALMESYLGKPAAEFSFNGKKYTPKTFAKELGIVSSDYVKLSSFSHVPFYKANVIEVPDNWTNASAYNLPLDEFNAVVNHALSNGYTVAWGGDVSEKGFSWKNGIAIVADEEGFKDKLNGTDRQRFEKLSGAARIDSLYKFEKIVKEMSVTQELRQKGYDSYATTDDHGMHLTGIAKDQNGTIYYKTKNSWDNDNPYQGFLYMSETYFKYKTLDVMIHKDALPANIKAKLGIK